MANQVSLANEQEAVDLALYNLLQIQNAAVIISAAATAHSVLIFREISAQVRALAISDPAEQLPRSPLPLQLGQQTMGILAIPHQPMQQPSATLGSLAILLA